ncbi:MAG: hypothetical protein NZ942_00490 [Candidatus Aenigmarchaeota archaeon]|nr:hypothetical protein [Candidatus Aenigmarchaeota archaeon]
MTSFETFVVKMSSKPISLEEEAKVCESLLENLRNLGRKVPTDIASYKSNMKEYKNILLQLYETTWSSDLPEDLKKRRTERIKNAMRFTEAIVSEEDIAQWSFHQAAARVQASIFCMSPIYMSRILRTTSWLRHFKIRKTQSELTKTSLVYTSEYERKKMIEIREMEKRGMKVNPRAIISKGKYDTSPFGQGKIVYSLSQFIEPSTLLLDQPIRKIEEIKNYLSRLAIPKDFKNLILNNIKRYKIEDIYPGPYILTLAESKREEITQVLREYFSRTPAAAERLCNPVFTWQFLFDAIFYGKKMEVLDCYLIPLGFKKGEIKISQQENLEYVV